MYKIAFMPRKRIDSELDYDRLVARQQPVKVHLPSPPDIIIIEPHWQYDRGINAANTAKAASRCLLLNLFCSFLL